jgi:hypothetical protein
METCHWQRGISALALAAISNLGAGGAYALCQATSTVAGAGPPSISATEASTAQALEILQRRKDDATAEANLLLASTEAAEAAEDVAADSATQPAQKSTSAATSSAQAKKKARAATGPQIETQAQSDVSGGWIRTRGTWALAYADYERNSDVNIGLRDVDPDSNASATRTKDDVTVTQKRRGAGTLAGMDWTYMTSGPVTKGVQYGFFGGYDHSRSTFSDGSFAAFEPTDNPLDDPNERSEEFFERTNAKETVNNGTVGLYGALFQNQWTLDGAVKIDFGDLEHEHTTRKLFCANEIEAKKGEVDFTDYIVSANLSYLHPLTETSWLQPIVGARYTFTDFGKSTGNLTLGAEDGHVFRIQGGVTWGGFSVTQQGYLITTNVTALLYSDVLIDGFVGKSPITDSDPISSLTTDAASLNDEGKVRVLGQFSSVVDFRNGYSLIGQLEARGGDDYYGIGGRLGARVEW